MGQFLRTDGGEKRLQLHPLLLLFTVTVLVTGHVHGNMNFEFLQVWKATVVNCALVTIEYKSTVEPVVDLIRNIEVSMNTERLAPRGNLVMVRINSSEPKPHFIFRLPHVTYTLTLDTSVPGTQEQELPNIHVTVQPGSDVTYQSGNDVGFTVTTVKNADADKMEFWEDSSPGFNYFEVRGDDDEVSEVFWKSVVLGDQGASVSGLSMDGFHDSPQGASYHFHLRNGGQDPKGLLMFTQSIDYNNNLNNNNNNNLGAQSLVESLNAIVLIPFHPSFLSSLFPEGAVRFVHTHQQPGVLTFRCLAGRMCRINCWAVGDNPGPVNFLGLAAGGELVLLARRDVSYQGVFSPNTFLLNNVTAAEAGHYACTTNSTAGIVRQDLVLEVV